MGRAGIAIFFLLSTISVWNGVAAASDKAERLYSRALVEFHAGRYDAALELLNQAVAADPSDPYAHYYRGVTEARLGDNATAATELEEALRLKPDLDEASLELGVTLTSAGDYDGAIAPLEHAQRVPGLEAKASLFLGLAYLRLQKFDEAERSFTRASSDPELRVSSEYYLGVVAYEKRQWGEAQRRFSNVVAVNPHSDMGGEASAFLERLRQGQEGLYHVYGGTSFQYDSNVQIAPNDDTFKTAQGLKGHDDDGRFTIAAGAVVSPLRSEQFHLSIGYEFFQSLHFDLTDFNIQNHRVEAQMATRWQFVRAGFLTRYDFFARTLDVEKFLQQATAIPWLAVDENGAGRVELYYRFRWRDFLDHTFEERNAFNHAAGARQFLYLGSPERYVSVGYQFDREDPYEGPGSTTDPRGPDRFAYDGHEVNLGFGWTLPGEVRTDIGYAYRHEQYPHGSLHGFPDSEGRRDKVHHVVLVLRRPITSFLDVVGGYFATFNGSNDPNFDYDRHIGSIGVEVSF